MKNDEERLAFALRFAQTDLESFRAGDWLNLRDDMLAFLEWSPRWRETLTPENLTPLKDEAARVLHGIAQTFAPQKPGDWEVHLPRVLVTDKKVERKDVFKLLGDKRRGVALGVEHLDFLYFDFTEPGRLLVGASLRDSFLFSLLATLSQLDVSYLRQCPACSRLFYAEHGRQIFCTPQCASRAGTKRFREKHREQENERGKGNYEKRIKKKLGPGVRINKQSKAKRRKEK